MKWKSDKLYKWIVEKSVAKEDWLVLFAHDWDQIGKKCFVFCVWEYNNYSLKKIFDIILTTFSNQTWNFLESEILALFLLIFHGKSDTIRYQ